MRGEKLATRSLEINLATHCNLKCYGCGRGSPAFSDEYLCISSLTDDLAALSKVLTVGEFKLAGGEPLLHPQTLDVIDVVRDSGITDHITLITNGVLLHRAGEELWRRIDGLWVSVYPGVRRRLSEAQIMALGEKHRVRVRYKITDTFNHRMLNAENQDRRLVREIYSTCYQRIGCHSVHKGRFYKCAPGPFIPDWLRQVGLDTPDFSRDGVALHGNPDLRRALEDYLRSDEPLAACRFCLGGAGKSFENRQMSKKGIQDWLSESHSDVRALVDFERLATAKTWDRKSFSGLL